MMQMPKPGRKFTAGLVLQLLGSLLSPSSPAQEASQVSFFDPGAVIEQIDAYQELLSEQNYNEEVVSQALDLIAKNRRLADQCVAQTKPEVRRLDEELSILGEWSEIESIDISERRNTIRGARSAASARLSNCELVLSRASDLTELAEQRRARFSRQRVLSRSEPLWGNLTDKAERIKAWPGRIKVALQLPPAASAALPPLWMLSILMILAIAVGLALRIAFKRWYRRERADEKPPELKYLLPWPLAEYAPVLLAGLVAAIVINLYVDEPLFASAPFRLALATLGYGIGRVLIDWSTGPLSPAAEVSGLVPGKVRPVRRRLHWFIVVLLTSFVFLGPHWLARISETADVLPHSVLTILLAMTLIAILLVARRVSGLRKRSRFIRTLALLVCVGSVVAEVLGYHNLANYLIHGVVLSSLAGFAIWMLLWLIQQASAAIATGTHPVAYRIRSALGIRPTETSKGLGPYQLLIDLAVWFSFIIILIMIWDASGTILARLGNYATTGIPVGAMTILPANILTGIIAFAGLLLVTSWIKGLIQRRWVRQVTIDRGARDSMITLTGYAGFSIATIAGLSLAGVSLTGLAYVAGGLSVGIGFGLQTIANNFISGIILLFERPVKVGDFITIGGVEGFVKRISIRSTEIETLDSQNVIVPNSELVSAQVTNWVLHDPHGRLRINVGVAYGSDTELVKKILEEEAGKHPEVITDVTRATPPKALFMGFGDSSLDFELRVRVKRIERRYDVISDINFAVDKAFRKADITIPFPQRDLHIKTYPPGWADQNPGTD